MRCPVCDSEWSDELSEGMRFCGHCGSSLALGMPIERHGPASAPGGELRHTTVLFADLANYTAFAEERSADEVAGVIDDLMQRLGATLDRHGGTMEKFIGDAILATFGLVRADASAARNAVRAGLEIQAVMGELEARAGFNLALRVGIHSGEVMYREVGSAWTVLGDTVNTASRIESMTPPGRVWISRAVYEDVARYFEITVRPTVELKGKSESVQPYEIVSERRTPARAPLPLTGRGSEWETLLETVEDSLATRSLRVAVIRGPAGIGKSRLVDELGDWIERDERVFNYDQVPYDEPDRLPAHGLSTILRNRFELDGSEDDAARVGTIEAKLASIGPRRNDADRERAAEFIAFVLGGLGPGFGISEIRGMALWAGAFAEVRRWMESLAAVDPWVIVLEDAHWGDAQTAAFIDWALTVPWSGPVTVIVTVRDEDFDEESQWYRTLTSWQRRNDVRELRLAELETEALAVALTEIGDDVLDPPSARRIAEHSEGNPLFAIELVDLLRQRGLLSSANELDPAALPTTMREVLEARIERLGRNGKEVAKRGALVGRRFTRSAVEQTWEGPEVGIEQGFEILRETETIFEEASRIAAAETEAVFRHERVRDAALARIPRGERLRWLARLEIWARGRLRRAGDGWLALIPAVVPLIVRSREERGELYEASLWNELIALAHLRDHRRADAIEPLRKAVRGADGTRRLVLTRMLVEALEFSGQVDAALVTIAEAGDPGPDSEAAASEEVGELLERVSSNERWRWRGVNRSAAELDFELAAAEVVARHGDIDAGRARLEAIEGRIDELPGELAAALRLRWARSWTWFLTELAGDPDAAGAVWTEIRDSGLADDPKLGRERFALLAVAGNVVVRAGRHQEALEIAEQQVALARELGDRQDESVAHNSVGVAAQGLGDLATASEAYGRAVALAHEIGHRRGEAIGLHNLAIIEQERGLWEAAASRQREYLALSRQIGNQLAEAYAPAYLGAIAGEQDDAEAAEAWFEQACSAALDRGWARLEALARGFRGRFRLDLARGSDDPELLRIAGSELAESEHGWVSLDEAGELYALLTCAHAWLGEEREARAALARGGERINSSWAEAVNWLDVATAGLEGLEPTAALTWFTDHGYVRPVGLITRLFAGAP